MAVEAASMIRRVIPQRRSMASFVRSLGYHPKHIWQLPENKHLRDAYPNMRKAMGGEEVFLPPLEVTFHKGRTGKKQVAVAVGRPETECPYCDDPIHDITDRKGDHLENRPKLCRRLNRHAGYRDPETGQLSVKGHPLHCGDGSLEGHHILPCEIFNNKDWHEITHNFGIDINDWYNGIYLPAMLALACMARLPLHRGPHVNAMCAVVPDDPNMPVSLKNYVSVCAEKADQISNQIHDYELCKNPEAALDAFTEQCDDVVDKLKSFHYKITCDGQHYARISSYGCCNKASIIEKQDSSGKVLRNLVKCRGDGEDGIPRNHDISYTHGEMGVMGFELRKGR